MQRRAWGLLLILALVLGGCSQPTAPPAASQTTTEAPHQPPVVSPQAGGNQDAPVAPVHSQPAPVPVSGCLPASAALPGALISRPYLDEVAVNLGNCPVDLTEDGFDLRLRVPRTVTREQVRAALTIDAPVPPLVFWSSSPDARELVLRFPAGKAGEHIAVRLKGPIGEDGAEADLGFAIARLPSPWISAALQRPGGEWEPVTPLTVLPKGQPVSLQFRLENGAGPIGAEQKIRQALHEVKYQLTQPEPEILLVTIEQPPPLIAIDFRQVEGKHGVILDGGFTLYTGEPPRLLLLDPATGKEELLLANAPVDLTRGSLSPDGRWLMLSGMSPEVLWQDQVRLLNMETKELRRTPLSDNAYRFSPIVWLDDRLIMPVYGQVQTYSLKNGRTEIHRSGAWWWEEPSPDGRYTIGYAVDYGAEDPATWTAPATLFLYDAATGKERSFPDLIQYMVPHRGGYPTIPTIWAEDGSHALIHEWRWKGKPMEDRYARYQRFDLATGQVEPLTGKDPEPRQYQEWLPGPGGWSYKNNLGWGALVLRSPDGAEKEQGYGLPLAWTREGKLLLVRWEPEERRHRYAE